MKRTILLYALLTVPVFPLLSQSKTTLYLGDYYTSDSSSIIMIPIHYDASVFSSGKFALWGNYYANILFYDFKSDSSKKLLNEDAFIAGFGHPRFQSDNPPPIKNITSRHVFFRIYNVDRNKNGRIDEKDPAILYVSDKYGNDLKALTTKDENVVSFEIFEKQDFLLVKFQNDMDADGNFENSDKDYYFRKLDLTTMTFGHKISLK